MDGVQTAVPVVASPGRIGKSKLDGEEPSKLDPGAPDSNADRHSLLQQKVEKAEKETYLLGHGFLAYFAMCFCITATFSALAVVLWSSMGIAEDSLKFLEDEEWMCYVFGGACAFVLSCLYLADFFWPPHLPGRCLVLWPEDPCVGKFFLFVSIVCFLFACMFCAKDYPYGPLLITIFLSPICILLLRVKANPRTGFEDVASPKELQQMSVAQRMTILRRLTGSERDATEFYSAGMLAYLLCFFISLGVWIPWAMQEQDDYERLRSSLSSKIEKEKLFMMWCAPLGVALSNLIFFLFLLMRVLMGRAYEGTNEVKNMLVVDAAANKKDLRSSDAHVVAEARLSKHKKAIDTSDVELSEEKKKHYMEMHSGHMRQLSQIIKLVGSALILMLGTFYVASELVAADSQIALMFQGFLGAFFLTFFAFIFVSFRRFMHAMRLWLTEMPLFRMAKSFAENAWIKAFCLACVLPVVPLILMVSAVNQCVRKIRGTAKARQISHVQLEDENIDDAVTEEKVQVDPNGHVSVSHVSKDIDIGSEDSCLTGRVNSVVQTMLSWEWISMTFKLCVFGICAIIYVISPRLLNVFLAWLSSLLSDLSFGLIIVMVWLSGICCFMLPPVPGVPVYIFGGLIIADQCPAGFWPGVGICVVLSFFLKLCACAMQQKLIGELLGNSVSIKQQVGIHKSGIRAIECVLRQKGFTIGKVAILCGGPDWPTSVMAGVLRLPLMQMLLGTTPIIFFIAPCVMTGSFYLKQEESEMWSRSGTMMMTLTMVVSAILWALAGWAIQDQFDNNWEYITRPMEKYLELDWLDYRQEELQKCCVITFQDVPIALRIMYVFFAIIAIMVGQAFYWRPTMCFGDFAVSDNVKNLKWGPSEDGLFKLPGFIGCIVGCVCILVLQLFGQWKKCKTNAARKSKALELANLEEAWRNNRREEAREAETKAAANASIPSTGMDGMEAVRASVPIQVKESFTRKLDKE